MALRFQYLKIYATLIEKINDRRLFYELRNILSEFTFYSPQH